MHFPTLQSRGKVAKRNRRRHLDEVYMLNIPHCHTQQRKQLITHLSKNNQYQDRFIWCNCDVITFSLEEAPPVSVRRFITRVKGVQRKLNSSQEGDDLLLAQ